jgi:transcription elongation GreA/GreB family factor
MAQLLLDKKVGDTIDFGNGFKNLEIKKYLIK